MGGGFDKLIVDTRHAMDAVLSKEKWASERSRRTSERGVNNENKVLVIRGHRGRIEPHKSGSPL